MKFDQNIFNYKVLISLLLILSFTTVNAVVPEIQREALVALYSSTEGDNWTDNTNWLSGDPCDDDWLGVTCDATPVVIGLNLYLDAYTGNNLVGAIPSEIGNLANLVELNLQNNALTGDIPTEIGNISNLEILNLGGFRGNLLTGSIPLTFVNLTRLRTLDLHKNQLVGTIPEFIGSFTSLEVLDIGLNPLTSGNIPTFLGNLTNLRLLNIGSTNLTGSIIPELSKLILLETLNLYANNLSGNIPDFIGDLSNLKHLSLGRNQLTGTIPIELSFLANLEDIDLSFNQLSGTIPKGLAHLSNLIALILNNNQLSGTIPKELGGLENLRFLYLYSNKLIGGIPSELMNLTSLYNGVGLELSYNSLSTHDDVIDSFINSKHLNLFNTSWSATQTITPLNLVITSVNQNEINLSWDTIEYTDDIGRYSVWLSDSPNGPFVIEGGSTVDKTKSTFTLINITPLITSYYIIIVAETDAHTNNQNNTMSLASNEVTNDMVHIFSNGFEQK